MKSVMVAVVAYPSLSEISGAKKVGAWISGADSVSGRQRKKFQALLPSYVDVRYRLGTFRIEVDVPSEHNDRVSVHKLAKKIRDLISKGLGVRASLCPVTSSARVLDLVRRG